MSEKQYKKSQLVKRKMLSILLVFVIIVGIMPLNSITTKAETTSLQKTITGEYVLILNESLTTEQQTGIINFDDETAFGSATTTNIQQQSLNAFSENMSIQGNNTEAVRTKINTKSALTTYNIGDTKTLSSTKKKFTLRGIGEKCFVWMDDTVYSLYNETTLAGAIKDIKDRYDTESYPVLKTLGADTKMNYADGSGKLSIFLEQGQSGGGYFSYYDYNLDNITGIHIPLDTARANFWGYEALLAHEGQHALNASTQNFTTWFNEGLSAAAMDMYYQGKDGLGWLRDCMQDLEAKSGAALAHPNYTGNFNIDYTIPMLFLRYLNAQANKGFNANSDFYSKFYTAASNGTGISKDAYIIEQVLKQYDSFKNSDGSYWSFAQAVANFRIAAFKQDDTGIYGFYGDKTVKDSIGGPAVYFGQSGKSLKIGPTGGIVVKTKNGSFDIPSDAGANIKFIPFNGKAPFPTNQINKVILGSSIDTTINKNAPITFDDLRVVIIDSTGKYSKIYKGLAELYADGYSLLAFRGYGAANQSTYVLGTNPGDTIKDKDQLYIRKGTNVINQVSDIGKIFSYIGGAKVVDTPIVSSHTVSVSSNNNAFGTVSGSGTFKEGDSVKVTATANSGYGFVNWTENGVEVSKDAAYTFTLVTANRNLQANFTDKVYSVSYNGNGSTSGQVPTTSQSYANGTSIKVSNNTGNLVKTGYTFSGWNTKADGSGTDYATGSTLVVGTANTTLYAKWVATKTYEYKLTVGTYSETEDIEAICKREYGPEATLADWTELKAQFSGNIYQFMDKIALPLGRGENKYGAWVKFNGNRKVNGSNVYYFVERHNEDKSVWPSNGVYDQIGGNALDLGGWNNMQLKALVKVPTSTKPVLTLESNGYEEGEWTINNINLLLKSAPSNLGPTTIEVSKDGVNYETCNGSYQINNESNLTYYFRATSASGVVSEVKTFNAKVDKTVPTGTIKIKDSAFSKLINNITFGLFFKETVDVTIEGADALSGVKSVEYQKVSSEASYDPNGTWTTGKSFSVAPDEKFIVYARITDNAGNVTIINSDGVVVDNTAPMISASYSNDNTWTAETDGKISVDVTDNLAGIKEVSYSIDGGAPIKEIHTRFEIGNLKDGDYVVNIMVTDKSDNSYTKSVKVKKDTQAPTITATGNTASYLQNDNATITETAGISEISKVEVKKDSGSYEDITASYTNGYNVTANGEYTFRVTNGAGATATSTLTYTKIDTTKPVVTINSNGYTENIWTNGNINLVVSNSASNLGITTFEISKDGVNYEAFNGSLVINSDNNSAYYFKATSASGVVSEVKTFNAKLDKTIPTGTIKIKDSAFSKFINNITFGLFFKETVDVTIEGSDSLSGVKSVEYQKVSEEASYDKDGAWTTGKSFSVAPNEKFIVYAKITDNAGNVTIINSDGVVVDNTAPTISATYASDNIWTAEKDLKIVVAVTENLAGIKEVSYSIDGGTPVIATKNFFDITNLKDGDYVVEIKATDNSGNSYTKSVKVKKDTKSPIITATGNTTSYLQNDGVTITATAGISEISKVEVKNDNGSYEDITIDYTLGYNIPSNGTYTFRVTNGAGATATSTLVYDKIDTTKPVVGINSNGYTEGNWTNGNINLALSNTASNLGATTFEVSKDGVNYEAFNGSLGITSDNNGAYYFKATSASGVVSEVKTFNAKLDKTVPTGTIKIKDSAFNKFINNITFGLFFKETVDVTIEGSDSLSGVKSVEYQKVSEEASYDKDGAWTTGKSFSVAPNEKFIVYAKITDNAGNVTIINSDGVVVDNTAPTISASYSKDNAWTAEADGKIAVEVSENLAGIKEISYTIDGGTPVIATKNSFDITNLKDGNYVVEIKATDNSGNLYTKSVKVKKDTKSPIIGVMGDTASYLQSDKATITATAGISGVSKVEVKNDSGSYEDITASYAQGYEITANGTYTFRITNGAGTSVVSTLVYDKIDTTKPVLAINSNGYTENSWTNGNINLVVSNSASNLGTTTFEVSKDGVNYEACNGVLEINSDSNITYYFKATSASGVVSEVKTFNAKLDKTVPTGTIKIKDNSFSKFLNNITFGLFFKDIVDVTIEGADGLSGVKSVQYQKVSKEDFYDSNGTWTTGNSFSVAPNEKFIVYAKITDNAGNVTVINSDGVVVYTDSIIENKTAYFDKDTSRVGYKDIDVSIKLNNNTLKDIKNGEYILVQNTDYTMNGDTVTLKKEYLKSVLNGNITLSFEFNPMGETFNKGDSPVAETVTVIEIINTKAPEFILNISGEKTYTSGDASEALTVKANSLDNGTVSYQWYESNSAQNDGVAISGATEEKYNPKTDKTGVFYYYVIATNTNAAANGEKTSSVKSSVYKVIVNRVEVNPPNIAPNTPNTTFEDDDNKIKDAVLTDADREKLANGSSIFIYLNVKKIDMPEEDKKAILAALNGQQIGECIDISLIKSIDETESKVTKLNNPIKIIIDIPENLRGKNRVFSVIRMHDGVAEMLEDLDENPNTITILTDCFSTYTIAYKDTSSNISKLPQTWRAETEVPFGLIGVGMLILGIVTRRKFRYKRSMKK